MWSPHFRALTWEESTTQRPVQPGRGVQLGEQDLVQPLPDTGPVPVPQPAPAGHAQAELLRKVFPLDVRVQDVQGPAQHLAIGDRQTTGVAEPAFPLRQEQLDALRQVVRHDPR